MALARALAVEPKVLLLDEPFGALDARVRKELRAWLRRLHEEVHQTTVLVTHDQEEAMEVADSIAVMDHGRIEQVGPARELYEHPVNQFVMTFMGSVNRLGESFVRPHDIELSAEPERRDRVRDDRAPGLPGLGGARANCAATRTASGCRPRSPARSPTARPGGRRQGVRAPAQRANASTRAPRGRGSSAHPLPRGPAREAGIVAAWPGAASSSSPRSPCH